MRKINVARPYIDNNDINSVIQVLKSGWLSLGPKYIEFEKAVSKYARVKYSCAVSSGTAGLHLAVKAIGLKKGDEVITTPFSFIASSNCLLYEGVKPVFVDIEESSYNIDPLKIERAITNKTKAILVVHIFGQSADMKSILRIAKKYNLKVIEDACESFGAYAGTKMTGTLGDVGIYAFYPNKQMTTGEGGMIVSNNKKIINLCNSMRNQGRDVYSDWLGHQRLGYNYRMDEISAALGITQLKKLNRMIEIKRKIAKRYNKNFKNSKEVIVQNPFTRESHSWFVYVIRVPEKRDSLIEIMQKKGIQTKPYFPVIHLQPFMRKEFGYKKGDYPVSEKVASQTVALPFFIGLTDSDIDYISINILETIKLLR
ncbi:MAG: polysaccharide biosynthesis protein [Candidatus Levybacteria bacterium CG10_big_fil_rev_8_21_14_0_10_35_13]|nr:MAG: polysaccharide biosynthesis protein [Candidatus Levybacteria bacterium CG10_big_fil_rev_8_21_14_0_10_35_13]